MESKSVIKSLEKLSRLWRAQFDDPPDLPLFWHINKGILMLNNYCLALASDVDPDACRFFQNQLVIALTTGSHVDVMIDGSFENHFRISEIVSHMACPIQEPEEVPDYEISRRNRKKHEKFPCADSVNECENSNELIVERVWEMLNGDCNLGDLTPEGEDICYTIDIQCVVDKLLDEYQNDKGTAYAHVCNYMGCSNPDPEKEAIKRELEYRITLEVMKKNGWVHTDTGLWQRVENCHA